MNLPRTPEEAAEEMALVFEDITGLRPRVQVFARDAQGRPVVGIGYRGDELVRAMQIEAFVVEHGDTVLHRSQRRDGGTVLVYAVEPKAVVGYHLSTVKPPRVVPAAERHKWTRIPQRGQTATCLKCGCQKCYRTDYSTVYRLQGHTDILTERPACSGPATT